MPKKFIPILHRDKFFYFLLGVIFFTALAYSTYLSQYSCLLGEKWCGQDMDQYIDYSTNMMNGHGFSTHEVGNLYFIDLTKEKPYIPEILRLPAYSIVLTIGRLVYDKPFLALVYNYVFYIGILLFTILISKLYVSKVWVVITGILVAFNPTLLFYTSQMGNVDTFVCFSFLGYTYFILRIIKEGHLKKWTIAAAIFGVIATLSRQNTILFTLSIPLGMSIISFITKQYQDKVKYMVLIIFIILGSMLGIAVRNYMIVGRPVVSALSGLQLFTEYIYFSPLKNNETQSLNQWFYTENGGGKFVASERKKGKSITLANIELNNKVKEIMVGYMVNHPKTVIKHFIVAMINIYAVTTFSWPYEASLQIIKNIDIWLSYWYLGISLVFFFVIINNKKKDVYELIIIWISSMFFISLSAFFHGIVIGNRGILPVLPLIVILSSYFLHDMVEKVKKYVHR